MKKVLAVIACFFLSKICTGQDYAYDTLNNGWAFLVRYEKGEKELSLNQFRPGDTIVINYSVAAGELGSTHEGIILTKDGNKIKAEHIIYNYGISFLPNGMIEVDNDSFISLEVDSIKAFFYSVKDDFTVLKKSWFLNDYQIEFLEKFFTEAENYKPHGLSNVPEYYAIIKGDTELIIFDRSGKWDKLDDLKIILSLK